MVVLEVEMSHSFLILKNYNQFPGNNLQRGKLSEYIRKLKKKLNYLFDLVNKFIFLLLRIFYRKKITHTHTTINGEAKSG